MNLAFRYIAFGLLVFAYASQAGTAQKTAMGRQKVNTVSLCQLTQHWNAYDHKIVRIEAIYQAGFEISEVYDPSCPSSDHTAWVFVPPFGTPNPIPGELQTRLNELMNRQRRAQITAIGEFDGPKKVEIPPGLSSKAADAMRETDSRYGHMNHWRFQFIFSKVEKVEAVPASDPWPRWSTEK